METHAAQCDVSHGDSEDLATEEKTADEENTLKTLNVHETADDVVSDADDTEVDFVCCRGWFNIRRNKIYPATTDRARCQEQQKQTTST